MDLSHEEMAVIKRFAEGDRSEKERAIEIYRDFVSRNGGRGNSPFINFMSEVDNAVPDLTLRNIYRKAVCSQELPPETPVPR